MVAIAKLTLMNVPQTHVIMAVYVLTLTTDFAATVRLVITMSTASPISTSVLVILVCMESVKMVLIASTARVSLDTRVTYVIIK